MKNKHLIFILFLTSVFSQVSVKDLSKLNNEQLNAIKGELSVDAPYQSPNLEKDLLPMSPVNIKPMDSIDKNVSEFFGYDYFKREISFFDNIPTPIDYKLGPGDEIIVSLWGENNSRENLIINKDGMVYYKNIGFINLSNMTLESAEQILKEELSRIYSTLKDKDSSTKIMLELGKIKSMNIYFSGNIENPGINLIHPFSDVFSAIIQAGGIKENGSLRSIEHIRNGKVIRVIDFYNFFMNGKNDFSNTKMIDGDVIHIPNFNNRVKVSGEVNRPYTYELLSNETISDIIIFASGFTNMASSNIIVDQITPIDKRISDDNAMTSININYADSNFLKLGNGDRVNILSIGMVDSKVEVLGRVKNPGMFAAANATLLDVLEIAGGFDDPNFRKTIVEDMIILRMDETKFYSIEISVNYKDAYKFPLQVNDKIFVYENINYDNNFTYRIEGQVNKPGTYPFHKGQSIGDAITLAGGFTELSNFRNINLKQEFTEIKEDGSITTNQREVNNVDLDFIIGINDVINVIPSENVVNVVGNVYNPGLITYIEGKRLSRYLELAGGFKPYSLKRKVYIKRANGNIEQRGGAILGLGKTIYPGDTIIVPVDENPSDFDITSFIADLSSTLANLAAILLIVDNQTN